MAKRDNSIMYSFRLNINNPKQLALHKILRDLDTKVHKSRSNYIIDILCDYLLDGEESRDDIVAKQGGFVTKEYVDNLKDEIVKEVEGQMKQELFNMVISATAGVRAVGAASANMPEQPKSTEDNYEREKLLSELNNRWT